MATADVLTKRFDGLKKIGVGARSIIMKARCRKTDKILAVKLVTTLEPRDRKYLRHLQNEYKILNYLQEGKLVGSPHPNIVVPHSIHKIGNLIRTHSMYFIMEFVPGSNLCQRADYSLADLVHIFIQVGDGLRFMHANGYVHGDMKPENVVVGEDLRAKLVDFGFSCPLHTKLSGAKGTRDYIAPEQVSGGLLTEMTDIYNFGASLYRIVTGTPLPALMPGHKDDGAVFISGAKVEAKPVHELDPNVPRTLSDIIMHCCERKPARRPKSMREVVERLRKELPTAPSTRRAVGSMDDQPFESAGNSPC